MVISFRVSELEFELVKAAAKKADSSVSNLLRGIVLDNLLHEYSPTAADSKKEKPEN